jgi:hypothetical protein
MHRIAPENEDALFLLMQGWGGYGYAFAADAMENAEDANDEERADYDRKRARMAYDRAIFYGLESLGQKASGFEVYKKNDGALRAWLKEHFAAQTDVPTLFFTGYAWLARVDLMKGDAEEGPAFVADLFVGVALVERAVELDASYDHYAGLVALAAYHARTAMAELQESKRLFEEALAKTERKSLIVQLNYATKYACVKGDRALYERLLTEVLQAQDPDPAQRLTNVVAKRRAKRWLGARRMKDVCGIDTSK